MADTYLGICQQIDGAHHLHRAQLVGLGTQAIELVGRQRPLLAYLCPLLKQAGVAQVSHQPAHKFLRVGPAIERRLQQVEGAGGVALRHQINQVEQGLAAHHTQQFERIGQVHLAATEGRDLVEQPQRIAV